MSNEVKVQQQGVSVGNDSLLERIRVCFSLQTHLSIVVVAEEEVVPSGPLEAVEILHVL